MSLRVTHVSGGTLSGSTRVVMNLLRLHDRSRFAPSLCFFAVAESDPRARAEADALGVPWREVVKRSRYELRAFNRLTAALRALAPDVVVLHGFGAYSYGALAARAAGVRAVVRVEHSPELYTPLYRLVSAMTARAVDSTILVSRFLVGYLREQGVELPHPEVIENGLELAPLERVQRAPLAGGGVPVALMAARLDGAKDHATLLDALALLARRGVALTLRLAGDGPFRGALEAQARALGLDGRVEFLGYRAELPALYEAADVVVLSTHFEGFGLAIAEGMAAGRPVVATRVAALPELIDPGVHGLLTAPRSAESLADALAQVIADPARARAMGQAGRARARERWSLAAQVSAFDEHLWRTALRLGLAHERPAPAEPLLRKASA